MTQPAVTFQIRQLEEYFNTRLFDRTHNRISLTEAGELVKSYADRIIALSNEMDNDVRTLTGDVQGPLVVGASTTIGAEFARQLARRGFGLILVARRERLLEKLARELRQELGVDVRTVADREQITRNATRDEQIRALQTSLNGLSARVSGESEQLARLGARDEQNLSVRSFPGQHALIGLEIRLTQELVNHLSGLIVALESQCRCGQALAAAQHDIAEPQGIALLLELAQFLFPLADARTHIGQFALCALDLCIACPDITVESLTLRLKALTLLLKGDQRLSQVIGPGSGVGQVATGCLQFTSSIGLRCKAALEIGPA